MVLLIFFFIFMVSVSLIKFSPMKLVICMEFMYMYLIFLSQRFMALGMNMGMYIMVFSAAEGVLGLTLVMDTGKLYDLKSKFFFGRF
uniref:NADH dehydrogenase subunit 4L n=1 Tax=Clavelina lepadiformis TaxID=159417 RepID=C6GCR7_CLALP|nr:NADH dehydrogenase subunit 4L [Clavelina lepadiformis]ACO40306.1 NADH dehydrogenase subunit 4L [Clavelina lepadiformis]CAL24376.1 NADH dehydrogenase subunit 4L [Clavelina lepadiformis]